ncbi:MAG: TerB family tellurite resistance protein [Alphaproteobacteria bacterium]|nr:TerB family tellurite resistance protein [Alphaproteobacteria bacterium]
MLERLKNLFSANPAASATTKDEAAKQARVQLATAALLAHAARLDGHLDEVENQTLHSLFIDKFGLTQTEAQDLLALAHAEEAKATDLYRWTSIINKTYDEAQKIELIEQIWYIVLADDKIHDYEANLLRRICGLIHVPDRLAGQARQRVQRAKQETK